LKLQPGQEHIIHQAVDQKAVTDIEGNLYLCADAEAALF
jgi:hypothetical protein